MNAYELAKYLATEKPDGISYRFAAGNAAIMLRQQADRIKELDKRYANLLFKNVAYLGVEQKMKDHILELEKDLALKTRDRDVYKDFTLAYEERLAELEKAKTLTDEEIIEIYCEIGGNKEWAINGMNDAMPFAKAILRKAQE